MQNGHRIALVLFGLAVPWSLGQGCPQTVNSTIDASSSTGGSTSGGSTGNGTTGGTTSGTSSGGATGVIVDVSIDNYAFTPKSVTIQVGQTVRWTNHEFVTHSVKSGNPEDPDAGSLFNSGGLGVGRTFTFTFDTPGTYPYHDTYYYSRPAMRDATVTVNGVSGN